ncbi:MAG: glycosyltransferase family protein [Rhodothermales bacterium]
MGLKVFFNVQGEGRGHMTQAIALASMLRRAGHEIIGCEVGHGEHSIVPEFFQQKMACDITSHASPTIKLNATARSIDVWNTTVSAGRLAMRYVDSVRSMEATIKQAKPDVLINFYDPLFGFLSADLGIPKVAIAHQYMFYHPRYPFSRGTRLQRQGMVMFTKLTAAGADRLLALSLYPAKDLPSRKVRVVPPILREELFALKPSTTQPPFLLAYLWRPELLNEVREWCEENGDTPVHCYLHHPEKKENDQVLPNLTLHHLNDKTFLRMMAKCSGVATTAGFETTAEAMWLEKPLLMVPTHIEQQCNALDASMLGGAYASAMFDLERLRHITPRDQTAFREWVSRADDMFVREIEATANRIPMEVVAEDPVTAFSPHAGDGVPEGMGQARVVPG